MACSVYNMGAVDSYGYSDRLPDGWRVYRLDDGNPSDSLFIDLPELGEGELEYEMERALKRKCGKRAQLHGYEDVTELYRADVQDELVGYSEAVAAFEEEYGLRLHRCGYREDPLDDFLLVSERWDSLYDETHRALCIKLNCLRTDLEEEDPSNRERVERLRGLIRDGKRYEVDIWVDGTDALICEQLHAGSLAEAVSLAGWLVEAYSGIIAAQLYRVAVPYGSLGPYQRRLVESRDEEDRAFAAECGWGWDRLEGDRCQEVKDALGKAKGEFLPLECQITPDMARTLGPAEIGERMAAQDAWYAAHPDVPRQGQMGDSSPAKTHRQHH